MNLKLIRKYPHPDCMIGELYVNNKFECYTCENIERPEKIPGVTAIPRGIYEIAITWSNRFKKPLPLLLNVPAFEGMQGIRLRIPAAASCWAGSGPRIQY